MTKGVLAGLALVVTTASSLAAANTYCYTSGGFSACASASIAVSNGTTVLSVSLQNLSGVTGNTYYGLTGFGLYYLRPPNFTGALTAMTSAPTGWNNGVPNSLLNPGPQGNPLWVGGAYGGGTPSKNTNNTNIKYALVGCQWSGNALVISTCAAPATFSFALSAGANFSLSNLQLAFRGQSWTGPAGTFAGQSFKCYSSDPNCVIAPTPVPEPATVILLGTGIAVLGAAGAVRRRRQLRDR